MQRPVKDKAIHGPGKGWHGSIEGHAKAGTKGGIASGRARRKARRKIEAEDAARTKALN